MSVDSCLEALRTAPEAKLGPVLDALERHGMEARGAAPRLVVLAVNAQSSDIRYRAWSLLPVLDPHWRLQDGIAPEILSLTFLLDDFDTDLGTRAEEMLREIGRRVVPYVIDVALEMDEDRRAAAMRVLDGMESDSFATDEAIAKAGEVLEKTESKFEGVEEAASQMLVRMGAGAVPTLLAWLVSAIRSRRQIALRLLGEIEEYWYDLVPETEVSDTLLPALKSNQAEVVSEVRRTILGMGDRALPYLADALELHASTPLLVLLHCVQLLGKMTGGDERVSDLLLARWQDSVKPELRASTMLALRRRGFRDVRALMPLLLADLEHAADEVRLEAIGYAEELGPAAQSASPSLARMLSDGEEQVVTAARKALEAIGIASGPALAAALIDDDREEILKILREYESTFSTSELERVRLDPVRALRNMGWSVAFAKDAMQRLSQRKLIAMELIEENGYQGQELLGFLQRLLDSDNVELRERAKRLYQGLRFL